MKTASLLLLLACAAPAAAAAAGKSPDSGEETFAPREKLLSNYDTLRKKSPFEFDPPIKKAVEEANPFEGISLAGYCGSGNQLTVYLLEGKEKKRLTVFGDGSPYKKRDESGFRVVGINRGKSLKTTEIILEKGGRQGTIRFEDDILHAKVAPTVGPQMIKDKNGKLVPIFPRTMPPPIPPPVAVPPVPPANQQSSQLFIPGAAANPPAAQQPAPGGTINGAAPVRPLPANFMDVQPPVQNALQGTSNAGGQYQGRRKVVLPR